MKEIKSKPAVFASTKALQHNCSLHEVSIQTNKTKRKSRRKHLDIILTNQHLYKQQAAWTKQALPKTMIL